jgi:chemosensory pili system protein ChpA (sensor histidine kinase/response regulator)
VDALEQLTDELPGVMLLDVEMPRMDGFELAKRLRHDERTKNLPIIMITSRTADKHRQYALELGVNEYMGKPFQEDELLANISRLMGT